jgi:protocatechuate 3,4-dioxygenase alpha subunit
VRYSGNYDLYHGQTPSQTLGPFFHQGLLRTRAAFQIPGLCDAERDVIHNVLASDATHGSRIRLRGGVYDGQGNPVTDALLEIWQADSHGRYAHPLDEQSKERDAAFTGFGRCATDEAGGYWFDTVKPGAVPGSRGSTQAPHINVIVMARGLLLHLFTRVYFPGDAELTQDPILALVEPSRRTTLLARRSAGSDGRDEYVFDVHLQGKDETVFFEV